MIFSLVFSVIFVGAVIWNQCSMAKRIAECKRSGHLWPRSGSLVCDRCYQRGGHE